MSPYVKNATRPISVKNRTSLEDSLLQSFLCENWRPLLPEILGQSDRVGAKSSIFALFSRVATQP